MNAGEVPKSHGYEGNPQLIWGTFHRSIESLQSLKKSKEQGNRLSAAQNRRINPPSNFLQSSFSTRYWYPWETRAIETRRKERDNTAVMRVSRIMVVSGSNPCRGQSIRGFAQFPHKSTGTVSKSRPVLFLTVSSDL